MRAIQPVPVGCSGSAIATNGFWGLERAQESFERGKAWGYAMPTIVEVAEDRLAWLLEHVSGPA